MQPFLVATRVASHLPDGSLLFEGIDLSLGTGRVGLVGANGVGKTTLLEILAGLRPAARGMCERQGVTGYLPQATTAAPGTRIADVLDRAPLLDAHARMFQGTATPADFTLLDGQWAEIERIDRVRVRTGIADLAVERAAASLSGGELTRVRLAALLLDAPDMLLLDEPTNHLDAAGRAFVARWVREWAGGLLVATHDRALLAEVDRIAELTPEGIRNYGGNYAFYREQREAEKAAAQASLQGAKQALRRAQAEARATLERQAHRSAAGRRRAPRLGAPAIMLGMMKRGAEGTTARLQARLEGKAGALEARVTTAEAAVSADQRIRVDLHSTAVPRHRRMVLLAGVNHRYAAADADLWPHAVNLELRGPERVAIVGANGSGKSTLLAILRGALIPTAGDVSLGTQRIGYLDQHVSTLDDGLSVLANLRGVAPDAPEHRLRILLGRFGLEGDAVHNPAGVLSGGERMRAGLACLLCADQAPELLLLDEPANHLDLGSQTALTSALAAYQGCLVLVSHDPHVLADAGITRTFVLPPAASGC